MENNRPLGPSPVRDSDGVAVVRGQRSVVLERLRQRGESVRVGTLADELGLHVNTVREHLEALLDSGLVVRERAVPQGRGRPAWLYSAVTADDEPDLRLRDYIGLATALAGHLGRTSADPASDAVAAGREWGRELAATAPSAGSARHRIVRLLDRLGFDPEADPDATTVALRRCPLLDAARRYPGVVCGVHLGIVRGALEVLGDEPERTALLPFAEPGACRLHLLVPASGRP